MKVINLTFFVFLVLFFTGCGSDYEENNTSSGGSSVANGTEACVQEYYKTKVIPEARACSGCHHSSGAASSSALIFPLPTNLNDVSNYTALKSYVVANPTKFIDKLDGTQSHNGGTFGVQSVAIFQDFTDFARNVGSCVLASPAPIVSPIPISAVKVANPNKIVDLAAQVLLQRSATPAEISASTTMADLDGVLDTYMSDPAFYEWIKFSFNEFLFTDKYSAGTNAINLLSTTVYPDRNWYDTETDPAKLAQLSSNTNYGIVKAPLELIAHVIKNNRSFSEILTANYLMVNPYSTRSYAATTVAGHAYVNGEDITLPDLSRDNFQEGTITGLPHAGILSDLVFLNRVPTTATNLNRERASKVMRWFLNTDILALANRAISSNDQSEVFTNPTLQNPNCAVCHKVMDPVTGTFKNWGNTGHYQPRTWPATSGPIGLSLTNLMDSNNSANALQWLASQIVADKRFARSSVHIFYKALTNRDALQEPSVDDPEYVHKMQAYLFQDVLFRNMSEHFISSGLNAKKLIKELIKSPIFSAQYTTQAVTNDNFGQSIGLAQLISPEVLDKKIKNLIGYFWTNAFNTANSAGNDVGTHYLLSSSNYLTLYGGIDSNIVTSRPDGFNGVMASVQSRMSVEMGCFSAPREFFFPKAQRKLLINVETSDEPTNVTSVNNIKNTIVHLHQYLLGEQLTVDSPEVAATYSLFYNVYRDGLAAVVANSESVNLPSMCRVTNHPDNGAALGGTAVIADSNYIIRAWSAVITYLLSDYKFIYNSNTN